MTLSRSPLRTSLKRRELKGNPVCYQHDLTSDPSYSDIDKQQRETENDDERVTLRQETRVGVEESKQWQQPDCVSAAAADAVSACASDRLLGWMVDLRRHLRSVSRPLFPHACFYLLPSTDETVTGIHRLFALSFVFLAKIAFEAEAPRVRPLISVVVHCTQTPSLP